MMCVFEYCKWYMNLSNYIYTNYSNFNYELFIMSYMLLS